MLKRNEKEQRILDRRQRKKYIFLETGNEEFQKGREIEIASVN